MSDIKQKSIDDSTAQERRDYAVSFLNLDIDDTDDDGDIVAKITAAQPGSRMIFVREVAEALQGAGQFEAPESLDGQTIVRQSMSGTLGQGDPRATIFIPNVDSEDGRGNDDIAVGINGRNWQLKRGENLNVPWRVVCALGLTEQDIIRHKQRDDGSGKTDVITTRAMRFPVSVIQAPPPEEIEAWRKATDDKFCP